MKVEENIKIINSEILSIKSKITDYKKYAKAIIFIGFFLLIFGGLLFYFAEECQVDYLIDYGSFAGGIVSSLFSLAGLLYIYVAFLGQQQQILYQRIDLEYNKEELLLTRNEIKNQSKEMKTQNETLFKQNFEDTFFQMASHYQKTISSSYQIMDLNLFNNFIEMYKAKIPYDVKLDEKGRIKFLEEFKSDEVFIDYAFIYQIHSILNFIKKSGIENKSFYIDYFKSTLLNEQKKCIYIILNYDTKLKKEIKETLEYYNIIDDFEIDNSFFEKDKFTC